MTRSTRTISMSYLSPGSYEYRAYFVTLKPGKGWQISVGPVFGDPRIDIENERILATKKTRDAAASWIDGRLYQNLKRERAEYQADLEAVKTGTMKRGQMRHAMFPLVAGEASLA